MTGRPLSEAELAGETIYRRENCARCHSLHLSPENIEASSLPVPPPAALLGSRVGPDLGLLGHARSDDWHYAHLYAPGVLMPESRMPASRHLFRGGPDARPVPTDEAVRLVAYMQSLGRTRRDVWAEFRVREPEIPPPGAVPAESRLKRGRTLYAQHCVACHGERGDGRGPAADLLLTAPRDFTQGRFAFRSGPPGSTPGDSDLFRAITLGGGAATAMPSFPYLSAEDRWALVARVKEFAPLLRGTPLVASAPVAVDQAPGSAAEGRRLWDDLGCGSCHGPDGRGQARNSGGEFWSDVQGAPLPGSGDLTHACSRRGGGSVEALERALTYGVGGAMPSFADSLRGRSGAVSSLALHLKHLAVTQKDAGPGGGPAAEPPETLPGN